LAAAEAWYKNQIEWLAMEEQELLEQARAGESRAAGTGRDSGAAAHDQGSHRHEEYGIQKSYPLAHCLSLRF
jgi:hypothetical protein